MNPSLTRDALERLLVEENGALGEFETLLDKEHGALRARDIDALEALADARQASLVRLLKIEDERRGNQTEDPKRCEQNAQCSRERFAFRHRACKEKC